THVLTVQTVVTWANEGVLWELMLIRNTADWKMYMEAAFERGWPLAMLVQTHEKPQAAADEENEVSRSAQREGDQAEEEEEKEVVQGSKYPTIDAVKEAVKLWSVSLRKEFRVVKSKSSVYEVKCLKEDCPWRVHSFRGRWKTHWECSVVTEHTCYLEGVEKS